MYLFDTCKIHIAVVVKKIMQLPLSFFCVSVSGQLVICNKITIPYNNALLQNFIQF